MRMAVIDGTTVINIIEAREGFDLSGFTVVPAGNANIGDKYIDGVFSLPPESLDELRRKKVDAVCSKWESVLSGGFTVPVDLSATLGGRVLQTRESDRAAWLTSQAAYQAAVTAGQGSVEGARFRPLDNMTTIVSYAEGLNVVLAMAAWGKNVYARSWELKDEISAADASTLDSIDVESGWPE